MPPKRKRSSNSTEDICSICLANLNDSINYCILTCNHKFHFTCIAKHMRFATNKTYCPNCRSDLIPIQRTNIQFDKMRTYIPERLYDILQDHIDRGKSLFSNPTTFIYKFGEEEDDFAPVIRDEDGDKDIAYLPDGSIMGHFSNIPFDDLEMIK